MFGITRSPGNTYSSEQVRNRESVSPLAGKNSAYIPIRAGLLVFFGTLLAIGLLAGTAGAYSTPESLVAAGNLYVSSVDISPAVLFTGEKGTATFYVTNGNANQSIVANHATFGDKNIQLTSGTYDTSANIGPLQTRTFVFSIATDAVEGTYYPTFSLSLRDSPDNLYYITMVKVDNTPLEVNVISQPDTFTQNKKDSITVQIANPRGNNVKNVVLEVSGSGVTATPSKDYIGNLAAGTFTNRTFSITPTTESVVTISVNYDNGDNHHSVTTTLPITFGTDKKKATPQMSNIQVKQVNGVYHVTGDITNAGLTTANGVAVTALSPAVPTDPYQSYVVGALKPDDFGSFEVTFTANGAASIPVQVSYKDTDGNIVTSQHSISISSAASSETSSQSGGSPFLPAIGLIIVIGIAGAYLYMKRKNAKQ